METTREQLEKEAADHKAQTLKDQTDVAGDKVVEKKDEAKLALHDLGEKAEEKWEDVKDGAKDGWNTLKTKVENATN